MPPNTDTRPAGSGQAVDTGSPLPSAPSPLFQLPQQRCLNARLCQRVEQVTSPEELVSPWALFLETTRKIKAGEEILIDYGPEYDAQRCARLRSRMALGGQTRTTPYTFC